VEEAYNLKENLLIGSATVTYRLDRYFIPENSLFEDTGWEKMKFGMRKLKRNFGLSRSELLDSLFNEVVVYHGNSIVHHRATGIHFYGK
jgi:hypothetical protein